MSPAGWVLLVFGAIATFCIGSFVNVVIDRLPVLNDEPDEFGDVWGTRPWGEVVGGHSRCSTCASPVRPFDNIPVVSWLLLRGKCRACGAKIPVFHLVVELLFPATVALLVLAIGNEPRLANALWLAPVGVAIGVIDLRTMIVPTRIVWPATFVTVAISVVVAAVEGEWTWLIGGAIGVVVLAGILFVLWYALNGMGFGDVRLAVMLGWSLGFAAYTVDGRWTIALFLTMLALTGGAILGIAFGVITQVGFRQRMPFGPPLIAATILCIAFADRILDPF